MRFWWLNVLRIMQFCAVSNTCAKKKKTAPQICVIWCKMAPWEENLTVDLASSKAVDWASLKGGGPATFNSPVNIALERDQLCRFLRARRFVPIVGGLTPKSILRHLFCGFVKFWTGQKVLLHWAPVRAKDATSNWKLRCRTWGIWPNVWSQEIEKNVHHLSLDTSQQPTFLIELWLAPRFQEWPLDKNPTENGNIWRRYERNVAYPQKIRLQVLHQHYFGAVYCRRKPTCVAHVEVYRKVTVPQTLRKLTAGYEVLQEAR